MQLGPDPSGAGRSPAVSIGYAPASDVTAHTLAERARYRAASRDVTAQATRRRQANATAARGSAARSARAVSRTRVPSAIAQPIEMIEPSRDHESWDFTRTTDGNGRDLSYTTKFDAIAFPIAHLIEVLPESRLRRQHVLNRAQSRSTAIADRRPNSHERHRRNSGALDRMRLAQDLPVQPPLTKGCGSSATAET